jgi:aldehyde dehydrogenase (NAD+)
MTAESIPQTAPAVPAPVAPDIPQTVAKLRATFATGRTRSVEWRKQQLTALETLMAENEAAVADALEQDLGRKPFEAWLAEAGSSTNRTARCSSSARGTFRLR